MLPHSHERSIRILLPEGEPMILLRPPESLEALVKAIARKVEVEEEAIRLTFWDSKGERMMLVGEKRYKEALETLDEHTLQMAVVLMPSIPKPNRRRRMSRSVSDASVFTESSPNRTLIGAVVAQTDSTTQLCTQIAAAMLKNSMRILDEKFKEFLYRLNTGGGDDIEEIDLSASGIGPYECTLLGELLPLLPRLRSLNLESNRISNSGLSTLCSVLPRLKYLHFLNLSDNDISTKGLKLLASTIRRLPELELVSVAKNSLARDELDILLDAAPVRCRVHHDSNWSCHLM